MYIVYLIILWYSYNRFKINKNSCQLVEYSILCLILLYIGTYAFFTDDYEPYIEIVNVGYTNRLAYLHIESIWLSLIKFVEGNVDLFRFSLCSILLFLLLICGKIVNAKLNILITLYVLVCFGTHITWLRQPIVYFIFLLGLIFLKRKLTILLSLACFISIFFLHKSSIILYILLPFIIFQIKNNRYIYWSFLILPFLLMFFSFFIILLQNYTGINMEYYLEKESTYGHRHIIFTLISYFDLILQLYILKTIIIIYRDNKDKYIDILLRIVFGVIYCVVIVLFSPTMNNTITTRLLSFGLLLVVFIIAIDSKRKTTKINVKITNLILLLVFVKIFYTIICNYTRVDVLFRLS